MILMSSSEEVYIKIYRTNGEITVAACDADVLGKVLSDTNRGIRFHVDPAFFKGDLKSVEELVELLRIASNATLVGRAVVEAAMKAGYVHPDAILVVEDTPIALFARI